MGADIHTRNCQPLGANTNLHNFTDPQLAIRIGICRITCKRRLKCGCPSAQNVQSDCVASCKQNVAMHYG